MRAFLLSMALLGIAVLGFPQSGFAQFRDRGSINTSSPGTVLNPSGVTGGVRGTVLYPGTGHLNQPNMPILFPQRLAGTISGSYIPRDRCRRNCGAIIPYPVIVGGYGYGFNGYGYDPYYAQPPAPVVEQAPPSQPVIINQYFNTPPPDQTEPSDSSDNQMKSYRATPPEQAPAPVSNEETSAAQPASGDQPTIYLIAFKDHNIVPALAYWMEGSTLNYISVDHNRNQASIGLIDRDLSQRLNRERRVDFKLPAN